MVMMVMMMMMVMITWERELLEEGQNHEVDNRLPKRD